MTSTYSDKPWLAHYKVPANLPLPSISLIDAFEETACRSPDAPAIHYFDRTISFCRLNELATRFAAMLAAWDIGAGDRVALSFQNDPQFMIAQLGVWKRGGIVVPLNPMFKQGEIDFHLQDSGARAWIGLEGLYPGQPPVERFVPASIEDPEMTQTLGSFEADESVRLPVGRDDTAYLVYTSGTTGHPKGAICLHRNVMFNAEVFRAWMEICATDVILGIAPLFHVTGIVAQLGPLGGGQSAARSIPSFRRRSGARAVAEMARDTLSCCDHRIHRPDERR